MTIMGDKGRRGPESGVRSNAALFGRTELWFNYNRLTE